MQQQQQRTKDGDCNGIEYYKKSGTIVVGDDGDFDADDLTVYHMCLRKTWDDAVSNRRSAYFPPTFAEDGYFTHATSDPMLLLDVANRFYKSSSTAPGDDWICVALSCSELARNGIATRWERPMPVGGDPGTPPSPQAGDDHGDQEKEQTGVLLFPHIYGGVPGHLQGVVVDTFPIRRSESDGTFLSIEW